MKETWLDQLKIHTLVVHKDKYSLNPLNFLNYKIAMMSFFHRAIIRLGWSDKIFPTKI
jgi:hypothetical protein